jgi:hypothetical protein
MLILLLGLCNVWTRAAQPAFEGYVLPPLRQVLRYYLVQQTHGTCGHSEPIETVDRDKLSDALFGAVECTQKAQQLVFPSSHLFRCFTSSGVGGVAQ